MNRELSYKQLSIGKICGAYGYSRQAYYKSLQVAQKRALDYKQVLEMVMQVRQYLPKSGCRKLHKELKKSFKEKGLKIGRDNLFEILREAGMLIRPEPRYKVTTDSKHAFRMYDNLASGFKPTGPNQLWVSDITYIRLRKGFCYLSLITDAYSRYVVGYHVNDTLELTGCLKALEMALQGLPAGHNLIHHSDRGVQYCSHAYTDVLKKNNIRISMADRGNCYQNALAERMNGILKEEFYLNMTFESTGQVKKVCSQAVMLYNNYRPHLSLDYKKPEEIHYGIESGRGLFSLLQETKQTGTRQGYSKRAAAGSRTDQSPPLTEPGLFSVCSAKRKKSQKCKKTYV